MCIIMMTSQKSRLITQHHIDQTNNSSHVKTKPQCKIDCVSRAVAIAAKQIDVIVEFIFIQHLMHDKINDHQKK